jgi:hypothetical protein
MIKDFVQSDDWKKWPQMPIDSNILKHNQPERLSPEGAKNSVCDSLNTTNK